MDDTIIREKTVRMLSFVLSGENYCIDMRDAKEVVRLNHVTRVPDTPEFIIGVMNLRGEIIPLIDVRCFFGLKESERTEDARVIVTDVKGDLMGILVDGIRETRDIAESSIQPPLLTVKNEITEYTKGQVQLEKDILVILDLKKVLGCDAIENLKGGE